MAHFNHFVTFPYLNSVERCSQTEILDLLSRLSDDVKENKQQTLHEIIISIYGVQFPTLKSQLSHKVIQKMCITTAKILQLQCVRFGDYYRFAGLQGRKKSMLQIFQF